MTARRSTVSVGRTQWVTSSAAYPLAKHDRPFSDQSDLIDLQIQNGLGMGVGLHSRFSASAIVDHIADEMRTKICKTIKERKGKVSILIDESTTISDKAALIIYIKSQLQEEDDPQFLFLDLVELVNGEDASAIYDCLINCLRQHGFDLDYLRTYLVSFTSDGASVLTGKRSGVKEKLKKEFPNIITWHCVNHRLELAVGDAVKALKSINHFKSFIEKLHAVYSQSPKNKRELKDIAVDLDIELLKIGKMLSTRWVASSYRTVLAVWNNYEALYRHFKQKSTDGKHACEYKGLCIRIQSPEFLRDLALMGDVLYELKELSESLQHRSMNIVKADRCIKRTIRSIESLKRKKGTKSLVAIDAIDKTCFKTVPLKPNPRHVGIDADGFLDVLVASLNDRLFATCAAGNTRTHGAYATIIDEFSVLYPCYWPSDIDFNFGVSQMRSLCARFSLDTSTVVPAFQDFVDCQGRVTPPQLKCVFRCCEIIAVSSAECERGFSQMNLICSALRNRLLMQRIASLMIVKLHGPPLCQWQPEPYAVKWLRNHRSADDQRVKKARLEVPVEKEQTAQQNVWSLL